MDNKTPKKILLTGGTGYLGASLLNYFINRDIDVVILKRKKTSIDSTKEYKNIKIFNIEDLVLQSNEVFRGIDLVVHTATCYGRNGEDEGEIMAANFHQPSRLIELCFQHNVKKFINCDTSLPSNVSNYAKSKKLFANFARDAANQRKLKVINMQLEYFYGPNEAETKLPAFIIKSCLRGDDKISLSPGDQIRDFIHIDDVVSAFGAVIESMDSLGNDDFYIDFQVGTGYGCSIKKFAQTIKKLTNSNTVLTFGEVPYRTNEVMCSVANNQALRDIGWAPKYQIESGLLQVIDLEKKYYQ